MSVLGVALVTSGFAAFLVAIVGIFSEHYISRERNQLKSILSSMGEALIVFDAKGRVLLSNQGAGVLLRRAPLDLIGMNIDDIVPILRYGKQQFSLLNTVVTPVIQQSDIIHFGLDQHLFAQTSDGALFPFGMTASPFFVDGSTGGVVIIFRDLTKEHEIDRTKSNFLQLASHQLRTPITVIRWYHDLLRENTLSRSAEALTSAKRYLVEINENIERMEDIINMMLLAAEIEGAGTMYEEQSVNVRQQCKDIVERLRSRFSGRKVPVSVSYGGQLANVPLAGRLFFVVFKELIANAIKYTSDKGKITCAVHGDGNQLSLRVADTGYGIPINQHNKVFTKFFRADNIQDKNGAGSGMGLYVVKRSVEILGGTIAFESKENEGTVFTVVIPLRKSV